MALTVVTMLQSEICNLHGPFGPQTKHHLLIFELIKRLVVEDRLISERYISRMSHFYFYLLHLIIFLMFRQLNLKLLQTCLFFFRGTY